MSVKIPDEDFRSPQEINQHPCITADRWLNAVPNSVEISQVCQDSYNTSLVIFTIQLVGPHLFAPVLRILSVDGDESYAQNNVYATLAIGHYRNPEFPINTNCATWFGEVVFDVGAVIPNYLSANVIVFELSMVAQTLPSAYGVNFPTQNAFATYTWNKGVLPSPVSLTYLNGVLGVTFEYNGQVNCSCDITCSIPSGVSQNITFCPGEKQNVTLYKDALSVDPYSVIIKLEDTLGNQSSLDFQSVINTKPRKAVITKGVKPKRLNVTIFKESVNGIELSKDVQYIVLKYTDAKSNYIIWKDWSHRSWNSFVDYDVIEGHSYGYCIAFRGVFGDISQYSDWTEITI